LKPWLMKAGLNLWAPFRATGIRVTRIAPDYRAVDVSLKLKWSNRNYVGTHFGGSLYAMTDPFYMLMLIQVLGRDYIVWDQAACIRFVKPGRGTVTAAFRLTDEMIDEVKRHTATGEPYRPVWPVQVVDASGDVVAEVEKTLYVRLKPGRLPEA